VAVRRAWWCDENNGGIRYREEVKDGSKGTVKGCEVKVEDCSWRANMTPGELLRDSESVRLSYGDRLC
jgi:hypothetical protein